MAVPETIINFSKYDIFEKEIESQRCEQVKMEEDEEN